MKRNKELTAKDKLQIAQEDIKEHLTLPKTFTEHDMLEAYNRGQLDRSVGRISYGEQWLKEYKENK